MTNAFQFDNRAPVGSLLKRPGTARHKRNTMGRSPRMQDASHLKAIKDLPCLKCGLEGFSEAAHVRMNSAAFNKRVGKGEKPDDRWTLPLCPSCHRIDEDSQHKVGEETFWHALNLNPLLICEELYKVSPTVLVMRAVVFKFMMERAGR